jgi:hypothetical protein
VAQDRLIASRAIFVAAALSLVVTGCGGGGATAARYSSAQQVVAALDHGGLRCTAVQETPGTSVVSGATSEASCSFGASPNQLIDVFPGTVTTAEVLHNSVSTGTQKIWSDVGPNWWVQTSNANVKRVQKILGGRIIGGPWHPSPTASTAPASSPALTADKAICKSFNANIGNGGESQIAQALVAAGTSVTPKLARDIIKAITSTSLHADLQAQVKVTLDCALVQNGVTP